MNGKLPQVQLAERLETLFRKQIQNSQVRKRKKSKLKEELDQDVLKNVPLEWMRASDTNFRRKYSRIVRIGHDKTV